MYNSIQFISCSVDPKGVVNPQDIEYVNIYISLHVKCLILLHNFNQIWSLLKDFS